MVRRFFNKVVLRFAQIRSSKVKVNNSATLGPGEYHYVSRPVTATEKTIARIREHQSNY